MNKPISVNKWTTDIGLNVELKRSDDQYQKDAGRAWFAVVEGKVVYPKKEDGVIDELTALLWLNRKGLAVMPQIKASEVKPTKERSTIVINNSVTLPNGVTLNEEQSRAYDDIVNGSGNILLTGNAGTGKSFVLDQAIKAMINNNRSVIVCATTGIAATHINGKTYHSALRMFPNKDIEETAQSMAGNKMWMQLMRHVELIVIDEVSMMHKNEFIRMDAAFRRVFDPSKPFGGKRLCLVGDFLQVEPVDKSNKGACNFVFMTKAWQNGSFFVHQLKKVVRQQDAFDAGFLNNIRRGIVTEKMKPIVEQLLAKKAPESGVVHIVPTNKQAEEINLARLNALPGEAVEFTAQDKNPNMYRNGGWVENLEYWDKNTLVPRVLKVKVGATVINLLNDWDNGLVNGDVGIIEEINKDQEMILVNWNRLGSIWMGRKKFHQGNEYKEYRLQIPLKTAWAITIHKSQGMTLDKVIVSSAEVFADGMCYVALSRVRSLAGLYLDSFNFDVVSANKEALNFYGLSGNLRGQEAEAECSIPDEDDNDDPNDGGGGIDPMPHNPKPTEPQKEETVSKTVKEVQEEETPMLVLNKSQHTTGGNMKIHEYLVKSNFFGVATYKVGKEEFVHPMVFRVITNDPAYWLNQYSMQIIEEIDRGDYYYSFLDFFYGGESFMVSVTGSSINFNVNGGVRTLSQRLDTSPASMKDANISFAYGDFDSQTIIRLKGFESDKFEDMSKRGLIVANSSKMVKRLSEFVKAVSGNLVHTGESKRLRIKVLTYAELLRILPHLKTEERAGKSMDGVSIMTTYVAKYIYRSSQNLSNGHKRRILNKIEGGLITNHTLRIITNIGGQAGLVKGNAITNDGKRINSRMRSLGIIGKDEYYDIFTSVDNFKTEFGSDGSFEFISLEPHHGPGVVKTNDQMIAQYMGIAGILDPEEIVHTFQVAMDNAVNNIAEGKDIELFHNLVEEHASTENERLKAARSNESTTAMNRMLYALVEAGLDIGVSQTLMFQRANFIKKMFLSANQPKGSNWKAPAIEKKAFMFEPYAYTAYIMTKEIVYLAGYDVDFNDQEGAYHEETQTFMIPATVVLECMGILGGGDFDDSVGVRIRKMVMNDGSVRLVAFLVRTPNDWGEYYIIDVNIDQIGPVFHASDEIDLPTIYEKDFLKFEKTSVINNRLSDGSSRPSPEVWDWNCVRYNAEIAMSRNSGVGGQVKAKMLQYGIFDEPFAVLPCANEDMIDALQQCKATNEDIEELNEWATAAVAKILQTGSMDSYWWYSRNMYTTANAMKYFGVISHWKKPKGASDSPIVRDLMIPREEMVHDAYDRMVEILNSQIVEIPELADIYSSKEDELKHKRVIKDWHDMFESWRSKLPHGVSPASKAGREACNEHYKACALIIAGKFETYREKMTEEDFYMRVLKLVRASWLMKQDAIRMNWNLRKNFDRWLYQVDPNAEVIVTEYMRDAIIWYRSKS